MPKRIKDDDEFTKANIKVGTKKKLEKASKKEGLYEYELLEKLLKENYPELFRERRKVTV
jgi:hypothetical protein